jgi:hypothetical protein
MNRNSLWLALYVVVVMLIGISTNGKELLFSTIVILGDSVSILRPIAGKLANFFSDSLAESPHGFSLVMYASLITLIYWGLALFDRGILGWRVALGLLLLYPIANLFMPSVFMRRAIFAAIIIPAVPRLFRVMMMAIRYLQSGEYFQKILAGLCGVFILVLVIPGFYFPPFFDGIAGWYIENKNPESYVKSGIKTMYSDGTQTWFRPSFFSPLTMHGRPVATIKRRAPEFYASTKFACFMGALYAKAYPSLVQGNLPNQKLLGKLSYPPHTYDEFDTRERYQPFDQVVGFKEVIVEFNGVDRVEKTISQWSFKREVCK